MLLSNSAQHSWEAAPALGLEGAGREGSWGGMGDTDRQKRFVTGREAGAATARGNTALQDP